MNTYIKFVAVFFLSLILLPSISQADTYRQCLQFNSGLRLGSRDFVKNGDVSKLQDFLISQGFLRSNITGYFGSQTYSAVRDFQRSNSLSSVGNMGPMTRERIRHLTCNIPVISPVALNTMIPPVGQVGSTVTLYGSNFTHENTVNFGNGVIVKVPSLDSRTLTFTVPYTLTPACVYANPACMIHMAAFQTPPGIYPVSVTNQNGQTSNSMNYTVTDSQAIAVPVISGIDSPSTLNVNQIGTWTVRATEPEGRGLSYSVLWGDESTVYPTGMSASQAQTFTQSSTFTHSYSNAGTYTVTFVVRGQNGQSARTSVTVQVTGTTAKPYISSVSPSSIGSFGTTVTIYGTGFSRTANSISFNGVHNVVTNVPSHDGTSLRFTVPGTPCEQGMMCAQVILPNGAYPITITNENGTSNTVYVSVGSSSQQTVHSIVSARIGSRTTVRQDVDITPLEIIEDSRCPLGVYCIQAGNVVVRTSIRSYDAIQLVNLTLNQPTTVVDGYTILITDVSPIKRLGFNINPSDYVITYKITR